MRLKMILDRFLLTGIISLCCLLNGARTVRIAQQKIYEDIENEFYCFRRLNATHQIGCQTKAGGNVGVLHLVETQVDIQWILSDGPTPPFIPVLRIADFSTNNLRSFRDSGRVTGVLVLKPKNETVAVPFSPDKRCPNENFGLYTSTSSNPQLAALSQCSRQAWNPENQATNMMFEDWNFPIFLITAADSITEITDCYNKFNRPSGSVARSYPLCAADLFVQQHAAVNTPTCMRRNDLGFALSLTGSRFCDPLSSANIFSTLFPRNESIPYDNRSVIVLAARMDSFSMFNEVTPGVDSAITGMVTMLSIARTLASVRERMAEASESSVLKKNILFAFFDGEQFDFIGSSATVYAMTAKNNFPVPLSGLIKPAQVRLQHLSHFIEVNQIGQHSDANIWAHSDPVTRNSSSVNANVTQLLAQLRDAARNASLNFQEAPIGQGLPPTSSQVFLKEDNNIAALLISNHEREFTNLYYNSFVDSRDQIRGDLVDQIAKVAKTVSKAVFDIYTGTEDDDLVVDRQIIQTLLDCFVRNNTCELFQTVSPKPIPVSDVNATFPLYVSVSGSMRQLYVSYVQYVLAFLTGEQVLEPTSEDECRALRASDLTTEFYWMGGVNGTGMCMRSPTFASQAQSPAFDSDNPQWNSRNYSTWTESVWARPRARIFLKPSPAKEWLTLSIGFIIVILSFFVVYLVERNSLIIFAESTNGVNNMSGNRLLGTGGTAAGC